MGKAIHLVKDAPVTMCGVNTVMKPGAKWTEEESQVTCSNCLKLLNGGQMGAPPPGSPDTMSSKPIFTPLHNNKEHTIVTLDRLVRRVDIVIMELNGVRSFVTDEENTINLKWAWEWLDAAKVRLGWAHESMRRELENENTGDESYAGGTRESTYGLFSPSNFGEKSDS